MRFFLSVLFYTVALQATAAELTSVSFFQDRVTDLDGRVVKFLTGSAWLLDREITGVPMSEGIVICTGAAPKLETGKIDEYVKSLPKAGVFMYRGQSVRAKLISGGFILTEGYLSQVVRAHGRGAILETEDGSLWAIPHYDQYDTGYWLPPYPVIIFKSERYLLNLKEGKKIWIEKRMK